MRTFRTPLALAAAALFAAGFAVTPAMAQQNQGDENSNQSGQDGRPAYAQPGAYGQGGQQAQQGQQQNRGQAQQRQQGGQNAQAGESGESDEATGGATMRERQATNVDISKASAPRIVVLFTGEEGGQGSSGLEIVFMDQQSSEGQARTASGGQEIVFTPGNAINGVVAHELEGGSSQGQARQAGQRQGENQAQQNDGPSRQLVVRAEKDGKQLEITEAAKQGNMIVMTVRMSQESDEQGQQQGQRQNQQRQNRNSGNASGEQQGGTEAVILVYLGEQQEEAAN